MIFVFGIFYFVQKEILGRSFDNCRKRNFAKGERLMKQLLLIVTGASYGLLSAAGVFTVLVAVGLIPRFAGKTHTAR